MTFFPFCPSLYEIQLFVLKKLVLGKVMKSVIQVNNMEAKTIHNNKNTI